MKGTYKTCLNVFKDSKVLVVIFLVYLFICCSVFYLLSHVSLIGFACMYIHFFFSVLSAYCFSFFHFFFTFHLFLFYHFIFFSFYFLIGFVTDYFIVMKLILSPWICLGSVYCIICKSILATIDFRFLEWH